MLYLLSRSGILPPWNVIVLLSHHSCWQRLYGSLLCTTKAPLSVFWLSYVFLKSMKVWGHNWPQWFSLLGTSKSAPRNFWQEEASADFRSSHTVSRLSDDLRILWNAFSSFITACERGVLSCHHAGWADWYPHFYRLFVELRVSAKLLETIRIATNNL